MTAGPTPSPAGNTSTGPLHIQLEERGENLLVRVKGMAAVEVVGQLSRTLQEAANRKPRLLAIDLSGLSFISSTGLGGMVAAQVTCQKSGTRMFIINPRPFMKEILEVTKLTKLFKICDTFEEAEQLVVAG